MAAFHGKIENVSMANEKLSLNDDSFQASPQAPLTEFIKPFIQLFVIFTRRKNTKIKNMMNRWIKNVSFVLSIILGFVHFSCGNATNTKNKYTHGIVSDARLSRDTWVTHTNKVFYTEMMTNRGGSFLQIVTGITDKISSLENIVNI